jgi:hypothetical protein
MTTQPSHEPANREPKPSAMSVISTAGALRVLLVLLAVWTFFEGFALLTGGFHALSLGNGDRTAEQIIGAQMLVFVPVYALLVWQRERFRLLTFVPWGAQLAIIVPTAWGLLFRSDTSGLLLMIVSLTFGVMLFYLWWHSHPLDFFADATEEEGDDDDLEEDDDAADEDDDDGEGSSDAHRTVRARDVARRPGRFRRRDG